MSLVVAQWRLTRLDLVKRLAPAIVFKRTKQRWMRIKLLPKKRSEGVIKESRGCIPRLPATTNAELLS